MQLKSLILAMAIVLSIASSNMATTINENRSELEANIKKHLFDNYLFSNASLQDNNTWISIELKSKTWHNPNDTKELVDSVMAIVKKHLPLIEKSEVDDFFAETGTPNEFIVYIDEPTNGFPVAKITVKESNVTLKFTYIKYLIEALEKIKGSPIGSYSPNIIFRGALGAMWSNVKLYYGKGSEKKYIGKIICFSGDYVIIRYPSGNEEPKYRRSIIKSGNGWYVDENDPALDAMKYNFCN